MTAPTSTDGRVVGPFEIAILGAAALAVVVWAGAALAALAASGAVRGVTVTAAGTALVHLPGHLTDPKSAWPPAAARQLPGAMLYWGCQTIVMMIVAGVGVGGWRLVHWRARRPGSALGVAGEAGFAQPRDLRRLAVRTPTPGRVTVGRAGKRLLACEPQASLAAVGPTGSGKTAGFAIPALLEWHGPVLATSVKTDLLEATIEHRRRRGKVWVYDPTGSAGRPAAGWTPLPACATWVGAMQMAAWMTEAAQARLDTVTDGDYWYTQARKALAPYLHAAAIDQRGIGDLVRWIDTQNQVDVHAILAQDVDRSANTMLWLQLRELVFDAGRHQLRERPKGAPEWVDAPTSHWPPKVVAEFTRVVNAEWDQATTVAPQAMAPLVAAQAMWGKEKRLRGSVYATVENVLSGWADPGVTVNAETCDIDFDDWLAGDNTIYIVAATHEQARLRPVLTVLAQQAIRAAYDTANASGGTLSSPCLLLLDEAGNTAPLKDLPAYASTARSHGITLITVWQDLAQIKAIYHDRAQTVLNNHRAKLFGTGIADDATLDYISRLVGDEERTERNLSADVSGDRRTISEHRTYRRAAPMDVVRRIHPETGVLLYGSELPALVHLRPWYHDLGLRAAARRDDLIRTTGGGRRRARLRQ